MAIRCPIGSVETRQIGLLWRTQEPPAATGCPIDLQQTSQLELLPEHRTHQSKEPGKAVAPLAEKGAEAQQQINQQSRPHLPPHRIGVVAEEVGQLKRLLEFLEKDLDAPTAAIPIGSRLGAPFQIVGQEDHLPHLPVDLDPGDHAAHPIGISLAGMGGGQLDQVVGQNIAHAPPLELGIAPKGHSIVLSGGYEDDVDNGNLIIYTGEGGRSINTAKQVADQQFTKGNLALAQNVINAVPVRVTRGKDLDSKFAPASGYRYDGLYRVEEYWSEKGKQGFKVYRYRLVRLNGQPEIGQVEEAHDGLLKNMLEAMGNDAPKRSESMISRVIRCTKVGNRIKELYHCQCQFCGETLHTPAGPYAECCHIRPLGEPHKGPDIMSNVLCLCPNCHVRFDTYAVTLSDDLLLSDSGRKIALAKGHTIDLEFVRYHRGLRPNT